MAGGQSAPDQDNCSTATAVIAAEELIQRAYQSFEKLLAILYQEAPDFSAEIVSSYGEGLTVDDRYLQVLVRGISELC